MIKPQTIFYESFIKICFVIYYSIENQRAKGGCNIFNIQNFSLDKYSYSNIETSRFRNKQEKVYEIYLETKIQSFPEVH